MGRSLLLVAALFLLVSGWWVLMRNPEEISSRVLRAPFQTLDRALVGGAALGVEETAHALDALERRRLRNRRMELLGLLPWLLPDEGAREAFRAALDQESREALGPRMNLALAALREGHGRHLAQAARRARPRFAKAVREAVAPLAWQSLMLLWGGLGVLAWLAFLVWRQDIVRPLRHLRHGLEAAAQGQEERIAPGGAGLVRAAAAAFNDLADVLAAARRELEDQVRQQTRALAQGLEEHRTLNRRLKGVLAELETAQKRLVRQEKMAALGTLAGGVAHEFNNILGGIRGCSEEALEEARDPEQRESLSVIRKAAERGRQIVEGLLRFSQSSVREPMLLDLGEAVGEEARLLGRQLLERQVALELDLEEGLCLEADSVEIHQVLHNLFKNALEAAPEGSAVEVSAKEWGAWIRVSVRDRGPGVPPELAERIFEPFFTTRGRTGGVGLGLAIAHGIVQGLSGRLSFRDRAGGGTVFLLELPRSQEEHG